MSQNNGQLFPQPDLDPGSKRKRAVVVLQITLVLTGCAPDDMLIDGDYAGKNTTGVKNLQRKINRRLRRLKRKPIDVDGRFGKDTRAGLKEFWGLDVNALPSELFDPETDVVSNVPPPPSPSPTPA